MALFGRSKTGATDGTVARVTLYTKMSGFGDNVSFGGLMSPSTIMSHMDVIKGTDPLFADQIINYMRQYEVRAVQEQNLPDPNDLKALDAFARKMSAKSKIEPKNMCLHNNMMQHLYVIEYGKPDPKLKLDQSMAKEMRSIMFARSPLDSKYEKSAQEIVGLFRGGWSEHESQLRAIGQQINDSDTMVLVARRAEHLCKEAGVSDFSIRVLEHVWDGIAGWMK